MTPWQPWKKPCNSRYVPNSTVSDALWVRHECGDRPREEPSGTVGALAPNAERRRLSLCDRRARDVLGSFRGRRTAKTLAQIDDLPFGILAFDASDARKAGEIRAALAEAGTPIGPYDALIAGQALARNPILVTRDIREFARVPGLHVEVWEGGGA